MASAVVLCLLLSLVPSLNSARTAGESAGDCESRNGSLRVNCHFTSSGEKRCCSLCLRPAAVAVDLAVAASEGGCARVTWARARLPPPATSRCGGGEASDAHAHADAHAATAKLFHRLARLDAILEDDRGNADGGGGGGDGGGGSTAARVSLSGVLSAGAWRVHAECRHRAALRDARVQVEHALNEARLSRLQLCRCNLKNINFTNQPLLKEILLEDCGVTTEIVNSILQCAPNIEIVSLPFNKLKLVPSALANLNSLTELNLVHNPLQIMDSSFSSWVSLKNLQILQLSGIFLPSFWTLKQILNTSFPLFSALHVAVCELNVISREEINLLSSQVKLEVLDLSDNGFSEVPTDWNGLPPSLQILNLSYNSLKFVHFDLGENSHLEVIDLSFNDLKYLDIILISGKTNLLDLSHNSLSLINGTIDSNYTKKINFSHNAFLSFSTDTLKSFNSLEYIDLGQNPYDCENCDIIPFQEWLNTTHSKYFMKSTVRNDLLCATSKQHGQKVADIALKHCHKEPVFENPFLGRFIGISLVVMMSILAIILLYSYKFETSFLMKLLHIRRRTPRRSSQKYKYDAYISYSNADRDWVVNHLIHWLEAPPQSYRLSSYERSLVLGKLISESVQHSMQLSQHFLCILSDNFINNKWCMWELEMARHRQFEEGVQCLSLVQLEPLDLLKLPHDVRCQLNTQPSLNAPNDAALWEKLPQLLGASLTPNT